MDSCFRKAVTDKKIQNIRYEKDHFMGIELVGYDSSIIPKINSAIIIKLMPIETSQNHGKRLFLLGVAPLLNQQYNT